MSTDTGQAVTVLAGSLAAMNAGTSEIPFSPLTMQFCAELSHRLLTSTEAKHYPDLMTFAFFCRKASLEKMKTLMDFADSRLGWGNALHIAPSNIPVNFAYSFVFGLLAGNNNVVRLPSRTFPQIDIFCDVVRGLLSREEYRLIGQLNVFVRFDKDSPFLACNSEKFDVLLIWGGDQTVQALRKLQRQPRAIEVAFSDRYSLAVLGAEKLADLDEKALVNLCADFYNDTFLVDQNACSSPHMICWQGDSELIALAKQRFWSTLKAIVAKKYELNAVQAMDKQIKILTYLDRYPIDLKLTQYGPAIVVADLRDMKPFIHELTGIYGLFFEVEQRSLDDVLHVVNKKYQTLTYFGVSASDIKAAILRARCKGIDRVVPVGSALDMDVIWDGYALINTLSRIVSVK